jgi:CubicO group peptidase (beta-lactamase class C family)
MVTIVIALPLQPSDAAWPTHQWPVATDADIQRLVESAFTRPDDLGNPASELVIHRGRIVAEHYGTIFDQPVTADTTLLSWSVAKSVTHAITGAMTADGLIDPHAPADVAAWRDDERRSISLHHLLSMTDGLDFNEAYTVDAPSDVVEMLFGSGKDDVAAYAISRPRAHQPGTVSNYSSGSTNIVTSVLRHAVLRQRGIDLTTYARQRLFDPIGMTTATMRLDAAGTFIGSSFVYATARDWGRFGLLYLRGGQWDGQQLLPNDWIDGARTVSEPSRGIDPNDYGCGWWVWRDEGLAQYGAFCAAGYLGQFVVCVPALDVVIGHTGEVPGDDKTALRQHLTDVAAAVTQR